MVILLCIYKNVIFNIFLVKLHCLQTHVCIRNQSKLLILVVTQQFKLTLTKKFRFNSLSDSVEMAPGNVLGVAELNICHRDLSTDVYIIDTAFSGPQGHELPRGHSQSRPPSNPQQDGPAFYLVAWIMSTHIQQHN